MVTTKEKKVKKEKERIKEIIPGTLRVAAKSNPNAVAGALVASLKENGSAELQAIGAAAVNQAVKAVAIARGYIAPDGSNLSCVPAFTNVELDGEERTGLKFIIARRFL